MKACPSCIPKHVCIQKDSDLTLNPSDRPAFGISSERWQQEEEKEKESTPIPLIITIILIAVVLLFFFFPNILPSAPQISEPADPHIVVNRDLTGYMKERVLIFDGHYHSLIFLETPQNVYFGAIAPESQIIEAGYPEYYQMITTDPEQDYFYITTIEKLEKIKQENNIDSDRFVETIADYVQKINTVQYQTDFPQYPVVTAFSNQGNSYEKSMLLAGLLSKAGYDVALLHFPEENHMAVGIKSDDLISYPSAQGYAVIETISTGYLVSQTKATTDPVIIKIGDGTKTYNSGYQIIRLLGVGNYNSNIGIEITKREEYFSRLF